MMKAYIQCISYYLPEQIVTNDKLIQDFPEWNADKVSSKTGILERHISASDETASDMAEKAALQLFRENSISLYLQEHWIIIWDVPVIYMAWLWQKDWSVPE